MKFFSKTVREPALEIPPPDEVAPDAIFAPDVDLESGAEIVAEVEALETAAPEAPRALSSSYCILIL